MSVLYRALWSVDTTADVSLHQFAEAIARWTQETPEPTRIAEGTTHLRVSQRRDREVSLRPVGSDAFEVVVTDRPSTGHTEWTTVLRVVAEGGQTHCLVELDMSSDDLAQRVKVGRPKVVRELLTVGANARLGGSRIVNDLVPIPANGTGILTDLLADPARTLPVVVCTEPSGPHGSGWIETAEAIATRVEGIATVVTLDRAGVDFFRRELGPLAVWDGGVRLYLPDVVTAAADGWRHRYYVRSRFEASPDATTDRIVYSLAQLSTRRRIPGIFRQFDPRAEERDATRDHREGPTGTVSESEFNEARERWELELEFARDEQSSVERELASATGHLARLKEALVSGGRADLLWGTQHPTGDSIPDEVQDASEAVLAAQAYLSDWLVLPDAAVRDLANIDSAPEAYNWGNKIWRGLRALAAYAQDRDGGWDRGGFWEWCASGPLLGWPATSKKLSMTESETVRNNDKLSRSRVFTVDTDVDETGEMTMLAHLKISEGGGNLAPRVYFHDDSAGTTKKVHVGLVGPHYLVPNKSTN
jgi:hypothetical protein